jgi:cytoskeletal protein CcmA (bactofilin family)
MVTLLDRAGSLARGLRRKSASKRSRRDQDRRLRTAIDQLESRLALAITTDLSIGGTTVGSFTDTPTGPGTIGDFVTVSIEGTRGTVIFNGGKGVADGTDIQTIEIVDASPDFQLTFNGVVRTANPVPYGSDGIIQMGTITTANVIRGINTVRGPAANVAVAYTPYGFTQSGGDIGSANISLTGDVTGTFVGGAPGTFVVATPLLPSAGTPVFTTVSTSVYNGGTGNTAITLADATGAGTTAGALTTAEVRNVEFQLTKFVGVNFSNRTLKDGGGLFVDTVLGDGEPAGDTLPANVGILLSQGLLAYSTIGIRKELQAAVVLGTTRSASVDGRMFVESATEGAEIFVGPQTFPTAKNSTFELVGGEGVFSANVIVAQAFQGVINLQAEATGNVLFLRGVGSRARLNADSWSGVIVNGDFAGQINATGGDIALGVSGNLTSSARINAYSDVSLAVGGSVLKGAAIAASDITFAIAGNLLGNVLSGNDLSGIVGGNVSGSTITVESDATLAVGGSILNSTIAADNDLKLGVVRSVTGSRFHVSEDGPMSVAVGGNVSKSRFTASSNDEEAPPDSLSLFIGGSLTDSTVVGEENVIAAVAGAVTRTQFASTESNVSLEVGGVISSSRLTAGDDVELNAARDATGITVLAQAAVSLAIGGNWSGTAQSADSDIRVDVAGSVLKGSSFAGYNGLIDVGGNFDGSVTASDLRFFVRGNVSMASRITAQRVTDWADEGGPNFAIGGRLDGIVNVGVFDAAPNVTNVTILGNGAGTSARFNVGRFETDTLVFNGNFRGNLRTLQDLVANLEFNGNVDRITLGGRVGSFQPGVTPLPVTISVAGRLLYLNSNSYFEATAPGKAGTFWNDSTKTSSTGTLTTGSYVTVVPTLQTQPAPVNPGPMSYNVPTAPTSFTAAKLADPLVGITVGFSAPTSNGNLPILYYEYTTDNGATWSRFTNPNQIPAVSITLPGQSSVGNPAFVASTLYNVNVRAVNALGSTAATAQSVTTGAGP